MDVDDAFPEGSLASALRNTHFAAVLESRRYVCFQNIASEPHFAYGPLSPR
jgi:hypothetical protein